MERIVGGKHSIAIQEGRIVDFRDPVCRDADGFWVEYVTYESEIFPSEVVVYDPFDSSLVTSEVIFKGKEGDDYEKYGADTHLVLTGKYAGYIVLRISDYLDFFIANEKWKIQLPDVAKENDWYLIARPLLNTAENSCAQEVVDMLREKGVSVDEELFMRNCQMFTETCGLG